MHKGSVDLPRLQRDVRARLQLRGCRCGDRTKRQTSGAQCAQGGSKRGPPRERTNDRGVRREYSGGTDREGATDVGGGRERRSERGGWREMTGAAAERSGLADAIGVQLRARGHRGGRRAECERGGGERAESRLRFTALRFSAARTARSRARQDRCPWSSSAAVVASLSVPPSCPCAG